MPDQTDIDIPKSQSKSLLPTREQHPSTLDLKPTPGLLALHEDCKNFEEAPNQTDYFTGRVLGMRASLSGDGKSKYRLPHLNMEPGQYLEDYVIYAALDEPATRMSTQDPEQVFFEMSKLTSGAQSKFEFDKNNPEKVKIWKKYLSTMTQHVVLAPKYSSSIVSSAPKAGTRIKIYLFQPHQISPGAIIHGLYEQEYDENIFSSGLRQLEEFFEGFNQFLTKAADEMQKAFRDSRQNVPPQQANTTGGTTTTSRTDAATSTAMNNTALRQYINGLSEEAKYDYFSTLIPSNNGTFKTGINEKNIVGFRTQTSVFENKGKGAYDDIFFLVWLDKDGKKRVGTYKGNTEPAGYISTPTKFTSLFRLASKQYILYTVRYSEKYGDHLEGISTALVEQVTNYQTYQAGQQFTQKYSYNARNAAGMFFHSGPDGSTGSAGCQTMTKDVFRRFMADILSDGNKKQELGYTLIDENTIAVPEVRAQTSAESNPAETSTEKPVEVEQPPYVEQ